MRYIIRLGGNLIWNQLELRFHFGTELMGFSLKNATSFKKKKKKKRSNDADWLRKNKIF